jgi:hypothetical protein
LGVCEEWQAHCGDATAGLLPACGKEAKTVGIIHHDLGPSAPSAWVDGIDQIIMPGGCGVNEVAFLHRATRTLLTD